MTPALIIPAFGLDARSPRERAYRIVRAHLAQLHREGWRDVVGFGANPAWARNNGASICGEAEVVVFNDADTLVPLKQIREAARLAAEAPGLVFAFREYRRLAEDQTAALGSPGDAFRVVPAESYPEPPSHGCVAISRACFEEAGGYDERLEMWEDCALSQRCEERWPLRRVDGAAVHLWHPRIGEVGQPAFEERYAASRALWEREYLGLAGG